MSGDIKVLGSEWDSLTGNVDSNVSVRLAANVGLSLMKHYMTFYMDLKCEPCGVRVTGSQVAWIPLSEITIHTFPPPISSS